MQHCMMKTCRLKYKFIHTYTFLTVLVSCLRNISQSSDNEFNILCKIIVSTYGLTLKAMKERALTNDHYLTPTVITVCVIT